MSAMLRTDPDDDAVSLYGPPPADPFHPPSSEVAVGPTETPPPPPDPAVWQAELVELLAGIEHVRWGLIGRPLATGAGPLLGFAEGTLHACEGLARHTTFPPHTADAQTEAVAKAGAFFSKLSALRPAHHGGLFRSVFSAFAHEADALDPAGVRDCLLAHHEGLHAYFALFTDHYQSSKAARGWVDAASGFLADYKAMIRDLA